MTDKQVIALWVLLAASVLFALLPIFAEIVLLWRRKINKQNMRFNKNLLWISVLLLASVWCVRFAVGYYGILQAAPEEQSLTWAEELLNSFVHALQTFSMDEDYTAYILDGKSMMEALTAPGSAWVSAYGKYASLLNFFAPIAGGAIVFDILTGFFPRIRLWACSLAFWRKKYYFSELNEGSLSLAKSLREEEHRLFCQPLLVFTDVYSDDENETSSELLANAKALGAICLNDDITTMKTRFVRQKVYFLIDEQEISNIKTLAELADKKHSKALRKTEIYIFYQDDSYVLTERHIYLQLRKLFRESLEQQTKSVFGQFCRKKKYLEAQNASKEESKPISDADVYDALLDETAPAVIRVRYYQNLICNLLEEIPLYTPILSQPDVQTLNLAVIGNGSIGSEMIRNAYWCGQLLHQRLSMNVVALDSEQEAVQKINAINPDILDSCVPRHSMLAVYPEVSAEEQVYNPPYCVFRYSQADVLLQSPESIECVSVTDTDAEQSLRLVDADYFLVSLGSDEANIQTAEELYRSIASRQLCTGDSKQVVIAYVVYDPQLCRAVNDFAKESRSKTKHTPNIRMRAISGLDEVYSYENLFMRGQNEKAHAVDARYQRLAHREGLAESETRSEESKGKRLSHRELIAESEARSEKAYNYQSSLANSIHEKYKLFSTYVYHKTAGTTNADWNTWLSEHGDYLCDASETELRQWLGWLEHRRWNAYMRSIGFRRSCVAAQMQGDNKFMLKRHSCLVECQMPSQRSERPDYLDVQSKNDNKPYKDWDLPRVRGEE